MLRTPAPLIGALYVLRVGTMDPKSILDALRKASPIDVFLVSFFLLPFAFEAWNTVLDDVGFGHNESKRPVWASIA